MFYHLNFVITFWLGAYYAILEPGLQIVNPALSLVQEPTNMTLCILLLSYLFICRRFALTKYFITKPIPWISLVCISCALFRYA